MGVLRHVKSQKTADFCRPGLVHGYVKSSCQGQKEKQEIKRKRNPHVLIPWQVPAKWMLPCLEGLIVFLSSIREHLQPQINDILVMHVNCLIAQLQKQSCLSIIFSGRKFSRCQIFCYVFLFVSNHCLPYMSSILNLTIWWCQCHCNSKIFWGV